MGINKSSWVLVIDQKSWFVIIAFVGILIWLGFKLRYHLWLPNLDGKHVLITGGSSGLGKCVALEAARLGAHVSIIGRNSVKLFDARTDIMRAKKNPDQLVTYSVADVGDLSGLEDAIEIIVGAVKEIDILITCAAFALCGKIEEVPYFAINSMIQTNLIGTINCIKLVVPAMKRRRSGNIILMGSQISLMGLYGYSAYASTKFAIRGVAESLQMEVEPYNVQVTLCLPSDFDTPGFEPEIECKSDVANMLSTLEAVPDPEAVAAAMFKDTMVCF